MEIRSGETLHPWGLSQSALRKRDVSGGDDAHMLNSGFPRANERREGGEGWRSDQPSRLASRAQMRSV
jgi:hypothetical protein